MLVVDPEKVFEIFGEVHDRTELKKSMGYETKEQFSENIFNIKSSRQSGLRLLPTFGERAPDAETNEELAKRQSDCLPPSVADIQKEDSFNDVLDQALGDLQGNARPSTQTHDVTFGGESENKDDKTQTPAKGTKSKRLMQQDGIKEALKSLQSQDVIEVDLHSQHFTFDRQKSPNSKDRQTPIPDFRQLKSKPSRLGGLQASIDQAVSSSRLA